MKRGWDFFFELMEDLWLVVIIFIVGVILLLWVSTFFPTAGILGQVINILLLLSPVWLTFLLGFLAWDLWVTYLRAWSISKIKPVLLEIKLPKEVARSPAAMEIFFSHLYQKGAASTLERYWQGKIRPWFSLELVSLGGHVHFYIWMDDKWRNLVEAQLYAQYPEVVIQEVDDYTNEVQWDPQKWGMWGTHFIQKNKVDAYPIKTYIDYGLDKPMTEEDQKVDPLTAVLEYLGSLKPHERCWIQILIQAHTDEGISEGRLFYRPDWKEAALKEIQKIRDEATPERPGAEFPGFPNPTKGQVEKIAAIERSISKYPFNVMIRGMYIAKDNKFGPISIPGLISSVNQYSSQDMNGLKLGWFSDHKDAGKDMVMALGWIPPFGEYMSKRVNKMKQQMLDAYKKRSIFYPPYKNFHNKPYVMNTEELATIFHLPGSVATTPTLQKIESKRAEPPTNLPL